jgi:hypothetical protein
VTNHRMPSPGASRHPLSEGEGSGSNEKGLPREPFSETRMGEAYL